MPRARADRLSPGTRAGGAPHPARARHSGRRRPLTRRATLTIFLAGSALSAVGYGMADSEAMILVAGCLLSFFNLGAWGALYAIGPELYPTAVRGTGTGAAAAFGRLASIIAPFLVPALVLAGGQWLAFGVFALAFAFAAAAAFTLPEQQGKALAE